MESTQFHFAQFAKILNKEQATALCKMGQTG